MPNLIGKLIGNRYLIESLVARGGMATVYQAVDQRLERKVALKVIHPHLANDPSFQAKFVLEAKTAAKLSHPNLVNVFDQGTDGDTTFLVMEFVPGITLRDALKDYGPLPQQRALEMLAQILSGLAAAHRAGILHRDLKPENVLLADDGRVKLGDFGLARSITQHTSSGSLVGTVAYLSPELVTRGLADARSDVYAAGIMLFELLTGKQPFEGDQAVQIAYQHANSVVPAPSSLNPEISRDLDELVAWSTQKLADDRPRDASEMLARVNSLINDLKTGKSRSSNATTVMKPVLTTTADQTQVLGNGHGATQVLGNGHNDGATQVLGSGHDHGATQIIGHAQTEVIGRLETTSANAAPVIGQRRIGLKLLLATLLVVLLSSGAGWWFGSGPGALGVIPNLTSKTIESARSAVNYLNPKISIENENSTTVTKGLVIRTEPSAGSYVARGSNLRIFVSSGPRLIPAPKLIGLNVAEATAKLLGTGFKLGPMHSWFSTAPIGLVYDYLGADGTPIPEGSSIELSVSLGKIPGVSGIDQAIAITAIQATGLKIASISQEFSDTVSPGKVIGVVPMTQPLGAGGSVKLLVSKGPDVVIMPKVIGETVLAAQQLLVDAGLRVIVNTDQLQSQWGIVKVKRVSSPVGAKLKSGDSVTISTK